MEGKSLWLSKVLMIDDSDIDIELMRSQFRQENVIFLSARSCAEGIRRALENLPLALIIIDIKMSPDGFECARLFREQPRLKDITLVAMTGSKLAGDEIRAREAGFAAYIEKPTFPPALILQLLSFIKR